MLDSRADLVEVIGAVSNADFQVSLITAAANEEVENICARLNERRQPHESAACAQELHR